MKRCRLKPTDACVPWLGAVRAPSARPSSPCARESRAAACGRAAMVGRCVSRERLLAGRHQKAMPETRLIGGAQAQVNVGTTETRIRKPETRRDLIWFLAFWFLASLFVQRRFERMRLESAAIVAGPACIAGGVEPAAAQIKRHSRRWSPRWRLRSNRARQSFELLTGTGIFVALSMSQAQAPEQGPSKSESRQIKPNSHGHSLHDRPKTGWRLITGVVGLRDCDRNATTITFSD